MCTNGIRFRDKAVETRAHAKVGDILGPDSSEEGPPPTWCLKQAPRHSSSWTPRLCCHIALGVRQHIRRRAQLRRECAQPWCLVRCVPWAYGDALLMRGAHAGGPAALPGGCRKRAAVPRGTRLRVFKPAKSQSSGHWRCTSRSPLLTPAHPCLPASPGLAAARCAGCY